MKLDQFKWKDLELMLTFSDVGKQMCFYFPNATLHDYIDSSRLQIRGTDVELSINRKTGSVLWSGRDSTFDFLTEVESADKVREDILKIFKDFKKSRSAILKTKPWR